MPIDACVVDDEEPVRRVLGRLLRRRNLEVAEFSSGTEALETLSRYPEDEQPALYLVDVHIKGDVANAHLKVHEYAERQPRTAQFAFMSGNEYDAEVAAGDTAQYLAKPFNAADVERLIEDAGLTRPQ